jgi:ribosomal protein S12 methylthiotransferase accessory factor
MAGSPDVIVSFPGGVRVEAGVGGHSLLTDQPVDAGGEDAAPSPYSMFLASLAACAGFYVVRFCRARGIDPSRIRLRQQVENDPETHTLRRVDIAVELPADFPAKYVPALLRAADQCSVKKAIAAQPEIVLRSGQAVAGGALAEPALAT